MHHHTFYNATHISLCNSCWQNLKSKPNNIHIPYGWRIPVPTIANSGGWEQRICPSAFPHQMEILLCWIASSDIIWRFSASAEWHEIILGFVNDEFIIRATKVLEGNSIARNFTRKRWSSLPEVTPIQIHSKNVIWPKWLVAQWPFYLIHAVVSVFGARTRTSTYSFPNQWMKREMY